MWEATWTSESNRGPAPTMGGATRLKFPLPHRRQKQPQKEVHSISAPMTNKAQKFLGTAEINIDAASPTSPQDSSRFWDTHSAVSGVSGISVTVSETTASGAPSRAGGSAVTAGATGHGKTWDQESDIIPKRLGISGSSAARSQALDLTTDASSLRRRGSGSTIVSYYDKSKLPLSISQQTSSSAMAKGLPNKAAELLDMECPRPAPSPPTHSKKKPGRLDLSHLLPSSASSRFARFTQKGGMVLGPDMLTRSPSLLSTTSAISPSGSETKSGGRLRRKLTKESLRSHSSTRPERLGSWSAESKTAGDSTSSLRKRATDTGNLHHLYEHYEQTSFRDTVNQDVLAAASARQNKEQEADSANSRQNAATSPSAVSPAAKQPRHHVSPSFSSVSWRPFPSYSPDEDCGPIAENSRGSMTSSNMASPAGEYATSVSSRHTRTSRASKMTESFADFDPNATSVLSLSSDSEDDYPDPPRTGTSNPSVGSRDSVLSPAEHRRPSNNSLSQESLRSQPRSKFRTSHSPQMPFLAIPEHEKESNPAPPSINPRTSSLGSSYASNNSPRPSISTIASSVRSPSRLSQVSMSTAESVPTHFSRPRQPSEVRHVAMLQSRTPTPVQKRPGPIPEQVYTSPRAKLADAAKSSQPTPPLSPSSMEFVIRGQHDGTTGHEGPILTLNGTDSAGQERFIAVTRQEEMLLAAMRAKRALMRENLQIADVEDLDRGSDARDRTASKKESLSSIKTVKPDSLVPPPLKTRLSHPRTSHKANSSITRFPEPPSSKKNTGLVEDGTQPDYDERHEQVLMYLDRSMSTMNPYDMAEPSPDLSDFIIDFDAEQFPAPPKASKDAATHSRNSSTASAAGRLTHSKPARHHRQSSFGRPRPDSEFMPELKISPGPAPPMPSYRGADLDAVAVSGGTKQLGSVTTPYVQDEFVEPPQQPQSRKKAVRISAVGLKLPEMGQWGDDG